jgi:hypothetical protein
MCNVVKILQIEGYSMLEDPSFAKFVCPPFQKAHAKTLRMYRAFGARNFRTQCAIPKRCRLALYLYI